MRPTRRFTPTLRFVQLWRYWLVLVLGLALFALAALQGTDTHTRQIAGREVLIGVATKAITGVLAIMIIRIVQDCMDRLLTMQDQMQSMDAEIRRLRSLQPSPPSSHLEPPGEGPPGPDDSAVNHRSRITQE